MRVDAYERETIINYNEADDMATIYTHDVALQKHLKEIGAKQVGRQGPALAFEVPRKWLKWPRPPSERRREASRQALAKRGGG